MSCNDRLLARHQWSRRVTRTESHPFCETDQWGRATFQDHVVCHAEFVCLTCGAVREEGDCGCDQARADKCPVRLEYLAKQEHAHRVSA